ncbi:hypothetical protein ACIP98_29260 [Streptomyces sp. NPDC088354]|uniref:hypothetical protein n=1 Tax=Streptomyces sp. NPDC088354 TaxID=3365856 RepID=UPI0038302A64
MKLTTTQHRAIIDRAGGRIQARPNTLESLVRLKLAEQRTQYDTGRPVLRHMLTEQGRAARNELRAARNAERAQRGELPAQWATPGVRISTPMGRGTVTGRTYHPNDDSHALTFQLDDRPEGEWNVITATSPHLRRLCERCDTVGDDSLPPRGGLCGFCAAQDDAADQPARPSGTKPAQGRPEAGRAPQLPTERTPAMPTQQPQDPTATPKPTPLTDQARRLVAEVTTMTGSRPDVDWATLDRLDDMPEDDAVKALDAIMGPLMSD